MFRSLVATASLLMVAGNVSAEDSVNSPSPESPAPARDTTTGPNMRATGEPSSEIRAKEPAPAATPPTPVDTAASAEQAPSKGRTRAIYTWVSLGTTFAYGNTYGTVGAGAGYVVLGGLAPNLEVAYSFGSSPTLWALRPGVTWFVPMHLHPFVGAYYAERFVSGTNPSGGVGARAGFPLGQLFSLAVTYDHALNCVKNCDIWTPQVSAEVLL